MSITDKKALLMELWPRPTTDILAKVAAERTDLKAQKIHERTVGTLMKNFLDYGNRLLMMRFQGRGEHGRGTHEEFGVVVLEDIGCFGCCGFLVGVTTGKEADTVVVC